MREVYNDLNIRIHVGASAFQVLNIVFERFLRPLPRHSHGNRSYEIHYIPFGYGTVDINGETYNIKPGTLYVTGPHVEHEQFPAAVDPMAEYAIYFKYKDKGGQDIADDNNVVAKFLNKYFWFGPDTEDIYPLMQQIFAELENKYSGYMNQVEALLTQCIIKCVRNYEKNIQSQTHFSPSNLTDSKYLIVEESFLYNFETTTLQNLAAKLGLSTRQTERFLKENYGKTFQQKKAEAKMSMAKLLLDDPGLTIGAIAERLNYSSIQHFSYAFKQHYRLSPSQYRKERAAEK